MYKVQSHCDFQNIPMQKSTILKMRKGVSETFLSIHLSVFFLKIIAMNRFHNIGTQKNSLGYQTCMIPRNHIL